MEIMENPSQIATGDGEKHNLSHIGIYLLDKRSRNLWGSVDPLNKAGSFVGKSVHDFYKPATAAAIMRITSECIIDGKEVAYVARTDRTEDQALWRVTILPADSPSLPNTSAVAICTMLPDNYFEITEDEKIVLGLLADDYTLKQIAGKMHRSQSAIDSKIKSLKTKMDCRTIGGLVAKAVRGSII